MTFISHARNLEDAVLWRALSSVERGLYIDVGAGRPSLHSATKAFYERGWRGLDIEPNPELRRAFAAERPEDEVLPLALADRPGDGTLHIVPATGRSSLDPGFADEARRAGLRVEPSPVAVSTLAEVCARHLAGRTIHFLRIDALRRAGEVLRGNDWARFRPWIVLVASTPGAPRAVAPEWEPVLLAAGYALARDDGWNRFYVAAERAALASAIAAADGDLGAAVASPAAADARLRAAERDAEEARGRAARAEGELAAIRASISWKASGILRAVRRPRRSGSALARRLRALRRAAVSRAIRIARIVRPRVGRAARAVRRRLPGGRAAWRTPPRGATAASREDELRSALRRGLGAWPPRRRLDA